MKLKNATALTKTDPKKPPGKDAYPSCLVDSDGVSGIVFNQSPFQNLEIY
jgi:hypothetical protein